MAGHISYILDSINKKKNIGNDIINFFNIGNNKKLIRIFYTKPNSYNRTYTLQIFNDYEYLQAKITTFVDKQEAIIYETKRGYHLTEDIFLNSNKSNIGKQIREAISNLTYIEFFELKNDKYELKDYNECKCNKIQPDNFYVDNSIDHLNPMELMSMIQTISNTKDEKKKKVFLNKIRKEIGIKN